MNVRRVLLGAVWLAIVTLAVGLVVVRRDRWGAWETLVVIIGGAMLVVFVVDLVLRGRSRAGRRAGDLAVVVLLLGAIAVLGMAFVASLVSVSVAPAIVVGVFLLVFAGILRDHVKALRRQRGG